MEFRKKPVVIEAAQWFKNGDHPQDDPTRGGTTPNGDLWVGLVVRYFRHPAVSGQKPCEKCGQPMHDHGWIDTLEGGHIVCPGDWIITGVQSEHWSSWQTTAKFDKQLDAAREYVEKLKGE